MVGAGPGRTLSVKLGFKRLVLVASPATLMTLQSLALAAVEAAAVLEIQSLRAEPRMPACRAGILPGGVV